MKYPQLAVALLLPLLLPGGAGAAGRAFVPEDFYSVRDVQSPQLSPEGSHVAYIVTSMDAGTNEKTSALWLIGTDGKGEARRITDGEHSAHEPKWSPDGRGIAFISTSSHRGAGAAEPPQVQFWSLTTGRIHGLTKLRGGVADYQWSPDGTHLACVSFSPQAASGARSADEKVDLLYYVHPFYKEDGKGFLPNLRQHLWVVDVSTGRSVQITHGGGWDDTQPAWSPDGRSIAFVSDRTGRAFDGSREADIWVVPADGGRPIKVSKHPLAGWMTAGFSPMHGVPTWSPDGKQIAFLAEQEEEGPKAIWIAASDGRTAARDLVPNVDLDTGHLIWHAEGLYYTSDDRGAEHVFKANAATGAVIQMTSDDRSVRDLDVAETGDGLVYIADDFQHPGEVFLNRLDFAHERQITYVNRAFLSEVDLPPLTRVSYRSADGLAVEGFLAKPSGWQPGKRYPLVVLLHGGPGLMRGYSWQPEYGTAALLGAGIAVFIPNFRGSSGYGAQFLRAIDRQWGGKAYSDVMTGLDTVLRRYRWIDPQRLGVTGISFGGYMTNWVISQSTRFAAAVTMSSISDFISLEGTRDAFYGHAHDFGGDLFQNWPLYWKYSPLRYAQAVRTPTLVIAGAVDDRVPLEQDEEWFRALRHFDVPAELVIFPHEYHAGVIRGEPRHIVESQQLLACWFDEYLNHASDCRAPIPLILPSEANARTPAPMH